MAKFRSKLKGGSKGKRWAKGQSSSSNPTTRKFRNAASFSCFQSKSGPSSLTVAALQKHENKLSSFSVPRKVEEPIEVDDDTATQSSCTSADSFASDWSGCSHMSFSRFLNVFRADSQIHKEMLAILAAVREVILENEEREEPTSTEYFGTLMTTLDGLYKNDDQIQVAAVLSLLSMGIKTVPDPVLKLKFDEITQKMLIIMKDYVVSDNNVVIKAVLNILSHMLHILEAPAWNTRIIETFTTLLNPFCIHSKPKWRKAAQRAVINIVRNGGFKNSSTNVAAVEVAKFCESTLNNSLGHSEDNTVLVSSLKTGQTTILHTLGLMRDVICYFPKKYIKSSCELILKLITLNYRIVTHNGFEVLHSLFSAQNAVVPAQLNGQLITALYDYQPSSLDVQAHHAWVLVMEKAHIHLADVDLSLACEAFPKIFQTFTQLWCSEKTDFQTNITHALEVLLKDAVTPACATRQLVEQYHSKLAKVFNTIESCLGYQYHTVWHHVLHVISVMFEVGGLHCKEMFFSTLRALSELRDSYKFTFNNELEHAVGSAIRALGPEIVLDVIPLMRDNGDLNIDRSWLLPVLRENVKNSTLGYFTKNILSMAMSCHQKSIQMAKEKDVAGAHSAQMLYFQLWNLLPSFCNNPSDIKENFKGIARVMGTALADHKDLKLSVMASLRKLINFAKSKKDDKSDVEELASYDKNYLPILFNIYTSKPLGSDEEGHRLAALETIKLFLTISSDDLRGQLFKNGLKVLGSSSEDPEELFIKESILDLIRTLVPYQSVQNIETLYNQCVKNLPEIKNKKEQKKAYRILEEICGGESENCKEFLKKHKKDIQRVLRASMETAAVSSKGARLRCFHYLLKAQPQLDHESKLIKTVIPEVILSCKDINEKCRATAYEILNTIGEQLIYQDQVQEFVKLLVTSLGGTSQMMSCTILAFASILHNFSGSIGQENIQHILQNVLTLTASPTREIVGSCFAFLKTYIRTLPTPLVGTSLAAIMKSFSEMSEDCKRHFRLRIRDVVSVLVRKFGADGIAPYVPQDDEIMLKRLRNLRKKEARRKRKGEMEQAESYDEEENDEFLINSKHKSIGDILADSDSEDESMDTDEPKPKKKRRNENYIQEDPDSIVDLADPTAVGKVSTSKPVPKIEKEEEIKKKEKDRGFKTGNDGRLIIKEDSSDSETDEKKNKISFDASDSEEESVETMPLTNRKRKRSDTASMASGFTATTSKSSKYKHGGVGIHRALDTSSLRSGTTAGSEYRSKKAKGSQKIKN